MPRLDTLHDILPADARRDRHITFIQSGDEQPTLSFRQLRERACEVLGALQRSGLQPGSTMLLFVSDNPRFVEMFWACVLGGMVPVPLAAGTSDEHLRKLLNVFAQFEQASVFIDPALLEKLDAYVAASGEDAGIAARLRKAAIFDVGGTDSAGASGTPRPAKADDLAFIQFSSGSTGTPKGILLTHRNLTFNIASMIEAAGLSDRDTSLSWMPLSHDMGLIGFHIKMLACGASHAIMRTELFARRPLLWLELAGARRTTLLSSPNFGYQHYLRQYALRPSPPLDLSAVRLIYNGAEPISAPLCRRFVETLAVHGLRPNVMFTVYGLAEATLAVAFPRVGAALETITLERSRLGIGESVHVAPPGAPTAAEFVKVGRAVPGTEVRIADAAGLVMGPRVIGHVQMRGANVTSGYHGDAARVGPRTTDGWFDTGDLGLFDDGQLVITGRAKDLFIINGQNHYPHDIERVAEQVPGIETNRVVAAGVRSADGETEELALFVLHRSDIASLVPTAQALRRVVAEQTGLEVAHIVPVTRIPKTSSGKLQRYALVQDFEEARLDAPRAELAALLDPPDAGVSAEPALVDHLSTLARLEAICARIVPNHAIGPDTDLLAIDLNSLSLARIHEAIDREFPQRIAITDLLDRPTLAQLSQLLDGPYEP